MVTRHLHLPVAATFAALLCAQASPAMASAATFRGTCEQLPTTRDLLPVPVRLTVDGDSVRFTRPLLDLDGNRRGTQEMARGRINRRGELRLQSRWGLLGNLAHGDYRGTLGRDGGTLTGTQTWTGRGGGEPVVRGCTVALVRETAASRHR